MDGIILINKPKNYTSRDIVNIVGLSLHTKKVGHTGTLDPLASGVLVICVNKGTKLVELLTQDTKEYVAEITLGIETDTYDLEGKVLKDIEVIKTKEEVETALKKLVGTYSQEVPIYSSVKINGKKLYEYARNNEEVVLPKRDVTITSLELLSYKVMSGKTIFEVKCNVSKGTYIRSLVQDIAKELDTVGVMSALLRTREGIFNLEDCSTIEEFKTGNYKLIKVKDALKNYLTVEASNDLYKSVINGVKINYETDEDYILFTKEDNPICLYKKDNDKFRMFKMF